MKSNAERTIVSDREAVRLVKELLSIPGRSCEEQAIAEVIVDHLRAVGIPDNVISFDRAHRKSRRGGQIGNLIVKLPGRKRGPRRLLMSHMDTVPLCVGAKPVEQDGAIVSKDRTTALGGDNRAGLRSHPQRAAHAVANENPTSSSDVRLDGSGRTWTSGSPTSYYEQTGQAATLL